MHRGVSLPWKGRIEVYPSLGTNGSCQAMFEDSSPGGRAVLFRGDLPDDRKSAAARSRRQSGDAPFQGSTHRHLVPPLSIQSSLRCFASVVTGVIRRGMMCGDAIFGDFKTSMQI